MAITLNDQHLTELKKCSNHRLVKKMLRSFSNYRLTKTSIIKEYQDQLLFYCAFPFDEKICQLAISELERIAKSVNKIYGQGDQKKQASLMQSGIQYSEVCCSYSLSLALWMGKKFGDAVKLDSSEASKETVREIFQILLSPVEYERITQGEFNLKARIKQVTGLYKPAKQLQWLLKQFEENSLPEQVKENLYQQLKIFVRWKLDGEYFNRSFLKCPVDKIFYQRNFIKKASSETIVKQKIGKPVSLSSFEKKRFSDIMKASLAFQCRETDPVTFADENELELFDMGGGLKIVLTGMTKDKRLSLESYIGYMAFKNGVPVSYGGGWIWGQRCKIGVNIYSPFRRGESALLFCQVLRLYHQHFKVSQFIVKPYQFGKGNPEGLRTGAFWFYWKLGFRPVEETVKKQAAAEWRKIRSDNKYRTAINKLQHFASCNMEWTIGKKGKPGFDAGKISAAITNMINRDFYSSREIAIKSMSMRMKKNLPLAILKTNIFHKQESLKNWALLTGLINDLSQWSSRQKKDLVQLVKLKQNGKELDYITGLQKHGRLWKSLKHSVK